MKRFSNQLKNKYFRRIQAEVDSNIMDERDFYLREHLGKYLSMVPHFDDKREKRMVYKVNRMVPAK